MLPFVIGAAVGAAGLYAAAMLDEKYHYIPEGEDEVYYPTDPIKPARNEPGLMEQLNTFFFKAQKISMNTSELGLKGSELIFTSLKELPDQTIFENVCDTISDGATASLRRISASKLKARRDEAQGLFNAYREVFRAANLKLKEQGQKTVSFAKARLEDFAKIHHSLDNEDWGDEFEREVEKVTDYIEKVTACVNLQLELLEQKSV